MELSSNLLAKENFDAQHDRRCVLYAIAVVLWPKYWSRCLTDNESADICGEKALKWDNYQ